MCYTARAVANDHLDRAWSNGLDISPLKMHYLVFLSHGWYVAKTELALVRESFQAWPMGPVIPDLAEALRPFGSRPIWRKLSDGPRIPHIDPEDSASLKILDFVWRKYAHLGEADLAALTCGPGTPWHTHYKPGKTMDPDIPDMEIKHYFMDLISGIDKRAS